ncbi:hypothetical protein [Salirhabdus sp. Marseille-P4669]|uniref:hypothetical protein n=1 Tax=Salirhabdus sp. Marseille-P4669 TaxID=2042310 RepID=UPI000C7D8766|nr:hypothetical protein [Salirhabdus sp. Marseille-P4669]
MLIRNKRLFVMFGALFTLFLAGCNTTEEQNGSDGTTKEELQSETSIDGKDDSSEVPDESNEEPIEEYVPNESDIVLKANTLTNVKILEEFMEIAGENGQDNEREIRVVKVDNQGSIIYDLQSRYDANANQAWIEVRPDMTYYQTYEGEVQDVFNNAPQQCSYMTKDEIEGYYKLFECRTHWEYRILPVVTE